MAQFQTIYRQDYVTPVCNAEYIQFRDYMHVQPPPWDVVEMKPGIEPKTQKDRPKRYPVHVEIPPKCPMCHPHIRKFDRSIAKGYVPIEPEIPSFKFELGQKRKVAFGWPNSEYTDTIHKFGRKVMMGRVPKGVKRKFFGRKKTQFVF